MSSINLGQPSTGLFGSGYGPDFFSGNTLGGNMFNPNNWSLPPSVFGPIGGVADAFGRGANRLYGSAVSGTPASASDQKWDTNKNQIYLIAFGVVLLLGAIFLMGAGTLARAIKGR